MDYFGLSEQHAVSGFYRNIKVADMKMMWFIQSNCNIVSGKATLLFY